MNYVVYILRSCGFVSILNSDVQVSMLNYCSCLHSRGDELSSWPGFVDNTIEFQGRLREWN